MANVKWDKTRSGYGYGDGSGDGYGYGYGDGSGYGYGDGSGYGDGYGDGYGYGSGNFWSKFISQKLGRRKPKGVKLGLWRSNENGEPCNGGSGVKAEVGAIHTSKGPLSLCERGTLHATLMPQKWKGDRLWIVAMHGEVVGNDEKFGCLKREILMEVL